MACSAAPCLCVKNCAPIRGLVPSRNLRLVRRDAADTFRAQILATHRMAPNGYLALILHAHLPYVRHPEYDEFLEEDWLYEAITETYLPLLSMSSTAWRTTACRSSSRCTLTPPLCHMLRDPLLQERYERYLDRSLALARREIERTAGRAAASRARAVLSRAPHAYAAATGTSAGSATWSPPSANCRSAACSRSSPARPRTASCRSWRTSRKPCARRSSSRATITAKPSGATRAASGCRSAPTSPGLDQVLQEANLRWFILDSHGVMFGSPRPRYAIYTPGLHARRARRPSGATANRAARSGARRKAIPGDPAYRDFYRDIGFDLSREYLRRRPARRTARANSPASNITASPGRTPDKDLYNRGWALGAADHHAGHFMGARAAQIQHLRENMNVAPDRRQPVRCRAVRPLVVRGAGVSELLHPQSRLRPARLQAHHAHRAISSRTTRSRLLVPSASSWGHKGYWEVWLDDQQLLDLSAPAHGGRSA